MHTVTSYLYSYCYTMDYSTYGSGAPVLALCLVLSHKPVFCFCLHYDF